MLLPPFDKAQPLFRGNLHGHTTHSDGLRTPEEVLDAYIQEGYDFTCFSDHLWHEGGFAAKTVNDSTQLNRDEFITIVSAELHCLGKKYDNGGLFHIVANGLPSDFACADDDETAPDLVHRAIMAGAYVTIAHPEWYSLTDEEAESLAEAHAVEIYNHSCVLTAARGSGIATADKMLQAGHRISFTASDDSHFDGVAWAGGWVHVSADNLDAQSIVGALKEGRHYSSTGAGFNIIALEGEVLMIDCTPVESIIVSGAQYNAMHHIGNNLTYAEFDLSGFSSNFFRITINDGKGGMAWSNPYFRDTLES
jgi:predicted metal-dependent phosphoesterase TrpH